MGLAAAAGLRSSGRLLAGARLHRPLRKQSPRPWPARPAAAAAGGGIDGGTGSSNAAVGDAGARLAPGLYVVATPIGNLGDLSPRAAATLARADVVLCEDTRRSAPLVARATAAAAGGAPPPLLSLHAHNEASRAPGVLDRLAAGQAVALVSDAGTPLLSDPGGGVVAAAAAAGHAVTPVPGPCAAVAAVSACGLDCGDFLFVGFLPSKAGARRAALTRLAGVPAALVAYVPARSLAATLGDAAAALGPDRRAAVARELTKLHETWWRGPLGEGEAMFGDNAAPLKGEVTLVVERPRGSDADGGPPPAVDAGAALASLLADGVPPSAAARALARALGVPRAPLYDAALRLKAGSGSRDGDGGGVAG